MRYAYLTLVLMAVVAAAWWLARSRTSTPPAAEYVGSDACAECHATAFTEWQQSQHAEAMREADSTTVLGDFNDASIVHDGGTTAFFRRNGNFLVRTAGANGGLDEFQVRYTFGLDPLQQYLVSFPGGRLQALGFAWDTRPAAVGGQRWFVLEPGRRPGDPLHWTGIDQNWNFQCADCHSTDLRKNYDAAKDSFATTWSEAHVGCESCHGPASNHVTWVKRGRGWRRFDHPGKGRGLPAVLDERRGVTWTIDAATGNAERSVPRTEDQELEVCARCHSRRGQFSDAHSAGESFHDAFRPALLEPGLYEVDGQQLDEVYTVGSFLTSRMHAKGVTCSDCHEPHSARLRAEGNAVCAPCHAPAKYESAEHHHHRDGSEGTQCVSCHMPARTYMQVDPRHDHSFRIPRPDRTLTLGTPNACNGCHADRSAEWAAAAVRAWFPRAKPGFQGFAEAFDAADRGAPGAQERLLDLLQERDLPDYVRASALARLEDVPGPRTTGAAVAGLAHENPSVRMAAVHVLAAGDEASRLEHLPALLGDVARVVRMDAARALAGPLERRLEPKDSKPFERALDEFVAGQRFNADRPEAHSNLAGLERDRGAFDAAEQSLRRALAIDPTFEPAAVNLADLLRAREREPEAERVLRDLIAVRPDAASAHHALGLSLVRQGRTAEALAALGEGARLAPDQPRYAYVYGVGLREAGDPARSRQVLEAALERNPYHQDLLSALAAYDQEDGRIESAQRRATRLRELQSDGR